MPQSIVSPELSPVRAPGTSTPAWAEGVSGGGCSRGRGTGACCGWIEERGAAGPSAAAAAAKVESAQRSCGGGLTSERAATHRPQSGSGWRGRASLGADHGRRDGAARGWRAAPRTRHPVGPSRPWRPLPALPGFWAPDDAPAQPIGLSSQPIGL